MEKIRIWQGKKSWVLGIDHSDFVEVEFEGVLLGDWQNIQDDQGNRGTDYRVFQAVDGTIIVHRIVWSRWAGEDDFGFIHVYPSLDEARGDWRLALENAGIVERQRLSLEEWRQRQ